MLTIVSAQYRYLQDEDGGLPPEPDLSARVLLVSTGKRRSTVQCLFATTHLLFIGSSVQTNFVVDETFLTKEFSRFGDVQDCVVKQHCSTPSSGSPRQYGYAFVYYANMESATAALEFLQHDSIMNNVKYACNLSHNEHHQPHQQGAPASTHATHHGHTQHHDGKDRSPSQMAQQLPPSPPLLIPAANMGPAPVPMVMPMPMPYPHHGEHYAQPLAPQFVPAPSYMANRPPMPLAYSTRSSSTDSNDAQYMHHGAGVPPVAFVFHPAHQRSPTAAPMMFTAMPMPQHPQSMSSSPPLAQQHSSPPLPPATMARSPPMGEGNLYAMPFPLPPAPLLNAPANGSASSSPPNAPQPHMMHPSSPGVMTMMPMHAPQYAYGAVPLTMPPMAPMQMQPLSPQAMPMGMAPQPGQMMMQAPYAPQNANHMKHTNQMRMEQHPQHHAQPHHYQHQPQHSHQARPHGGYPH